MKMVKEVKISSDKKVATVTITVPYRGNGRTKQKYQTTDVIMMLKEKGLEVLDTIQASMVTNCNKNHVTGTWVFLLKEKEEKKVKPVNGNDYQTGNIVEAPVTVIEVDLKKLKKKVSVA